MIAPCFLRIDFSKKLNFPETHIVNMPDKVVSNTKLLLCVVNAHNEKKQFLLKKIEFICVCVLSKLDRFVKSKNFTLKTKSIKREPITSISVFSLHSFPIKAKNSKTVLKIKIFNFSNIF